MYFPEYYSRFPVKTLSEFHMLSSSAKKERKEYHHGKIACSFVTGQVNSLEYSNSTRFAN